MLLRHFHLTSPICKSLILRLSIQRGKVGKKERLHVKRRHCFSAAVAAEASAAECLEQIDIDQIIIENDSHLY